jgi:hypothetical protein
VLALRSFNDTVMRENELFESHLQRTNPHLLSDDDEAGKGRKTKQTKRSQQMLTPEQKYDIAVQEMEEVREEIGGTKQNAEQLMDTLRARMEECDVRIAEIKKDAYEFKRDIVTGALPASMRICGRTTCALPLPRLHGQRLRLCTMLCGSTRRCACAAATPSPAAARRGELSDGQNRGGEGGAVHGGQAACEGRSRGEAAAEECDAEAAVYKGGGVAAAEGGHGRGAPRHRL